MSCYVKERRPTPGTGFGSLHLEQSECARAIRQFARRQEALRRRASRLEEEADALALELVQLAEDLETGSLALASDRPAVASRPRRRSSDELLRVTASSGVASMSLSPRADGSADVQVDGGKQFELPPTLADLLGILASDRGHSDDELVGWKAFDEIAVLLEKKASRLFTRHAITQQVYRLRRELFERGGVNPHLIQTNRRHGIRFALRRKALPAMAADRL